MKQVMIINGETNQSMGYTDENYIKSFIRDLEYDDIIHGRFSEDAYISYDEETNERDEVYYYSYEQRDEFVRNEILKVVRKFVRDLQSKYGVEFSEGEVDSIGENTLDTMGIDDYYLSFSELRERYYDWLIDSENDIMGDKLEKIEQVDKERLIDYRRYVVVGLSKEYLKRWGKMFGNLYTRDYIYHYLPTIAFNLNGYENPGLSDRNYELMIRRWFILNAKEIIDESILGE